MEKKEDLRIKKTKLSIRQAFLELCQKKPVSKITVTELSALALINKGTFYLHYSDIYALYLEIIKEICTELFNQIEDYSLFFTDPRKFVHEWYEISLKNDFSQSFPHFKPDELGVQVPVFFVTEFKSRIYATNMIAVSPENEIKIDCILCNLLIVSHKHFKTNPEITIKTIAEIIERSFKP